MADELTITASLRFAKGSADVTFSTLAETFDVTGTRHKRDVQNIGTVAEALSLGDVGAGGYVLIHNVDTADTVLLYGDATGTLPLVELKPGDWAMFRVYSSAVPYAKSITGGAADLDLLLVEL